MSHRPLARARIGGGRVGLSEVARARPKATQGPSTGRGAVGPAQSRGHLLVKPCSDPDFWLLCPTCTVRARATRAKVGFLGPALHCSGAILSSSALESNIFYMVLRLYLMLSLPLLVIHFLSKPVQLRCGIVNSRMARPQRTIFSFNFVFL